MIDNNEELSYIPNITMSDKLNLKIQKKKEVNMSKIDASSVIKKLVKTRIRVSSFNGNVKSTDGQYELANSNNADADSINVGVSMFPKSVQQQIREHSIGIRKAVAKASLPFQDGGYRIMPAKDYPALNKEVQKRVEAFRSYVYDEIYMNDVLKEMAQRRLGDLFRYDSFPEKEDIMDRYSAVLFFEPITDMTDLRIEGLTDAELETIKAETIREYEANLKSAQGELVANLKKSVEGILKKTETEGSRYKRALQNLSELTDSVVSLNILEDKNLNDIAKKIKKEIASTDGNLIKESKTAKSKLKSKSKEILETLDEITF